MAPEPKRRSVDNVFELIILAILKSRQNGLNLIQRPRTVLITFDCTFVRRRSIIEKQPMVSLNGCEEYGSIEI